MPLISFAISAFVGFILAAVVKAWLPSWELEGLQPVIVASVLYILVLGGLWYVYNIFVPSLVSLNERRPRWQELGIIAVALVAPLPVWVGLEWVAPHIADLWDILGNV